MIVIKKELTFDAAHRLVGDFGLCNNIHGHTYKVIVEYAEQNPGADGVVVNFGEISKVIKDMFDHALIVFSSDTWLVKMARECGTKMAVMGRNPTAENIAEAVYILLVEKFQTVKPYSITVAETPTSLAIYYGGTENENGKRSTKEGD